MKERDVMHLFFGLFPLLCLFVVIKERSRNIEVDKTDRETDKMEKETQIDSKRHFDI
jgi:hypothetical protein